MTQLGEGVGIAVTSELVDECLMEHGDGPYKKKNDLVNDSAALGSNLKSGGAPFKVSFNLDGAAYDLDVTVAAHHLIPGNESLLRAQALVAWMKKGKNVKGDVGYGVNHEKNGVWLPGSYAWNSQSIQMWKQLGATAHGVQTQYAYAYCAMKKTGRPWHDRHTDYSGWVKRTLEKFRIKMLDTRTGCSKCKKKGKKPWPPPYLLVGRMDSLSSRLRGRLLGPSKGWLPPFNTSRWAMLYALGRTPNTMLG